MKSFEFEFKTIPFNELRPDPTNIRTKRDRDDDHALKQSILVNGLIQPFIVCKDDKSGYLIEAGHRTHDACREIFKNTNPEVPCIVVSKEANGEFTAEELRKTRLLREIHTQKIDDWDRIVAVKLYADDLKLMNPKMSQKQIAETLGKGQPWLSKIMSAGINETFAPAIEKGDVSYRKSLILKSAPVEAQKALIDATEGLTLHDTERVVKQVSMGVRMDEALRTVKLSKVEPDEITVKEPEVKELAADGSDKLPQAEGHSPSDSETVSDGEGDINGSEEATLSPETPDIMSKAFAGQTGEEEEPEREADVGGTGVLTTSPDSEDVEPPLETKSTDTKITKFVNRMQRLGEATNTHMKEKELLELDDSSYRKVLKDYEEASFAIESMRDFLHSRENNGSVQFNRAKRLHNALREFDPHTITSVKEATDLRSIKIQTKKKLTDDVNILDNVVNGKRP